MSSSKPKYSSFEQLLYSVRITASCRMNAAQRLLKFKRVAFGTTTMLSLGLIFIPLWVLTFPSNPSSLKFSKNFLDCVQIFLAIATLVYSTIISMANHDMRIHSLKDTGGKLRALSKKLRIEEEKAKAKIEEDKDQETVQSKNILLPKLEHFCNEYSKILLNTEEHSDVDYLKAIYSDKELKDKVWECYFLKKYLNLDSIVFYIPILMILFEIIVILDLINATNILPKI